jgi:rhodanese-related sulfurtransferase
VVNGDEEGFVRYTTEGLSIAPGYFSFDAEKNREGAVAVADIVVGAQPLDPATVEEMAEDGVLVLDTRSVADFGAGHVPGAIHVQLDGKFAPWVGTLIQPEQRLVVVAYEDKQIEAITRLARVGYERITGWLDGGMGAWRTAGGEIAAIRQISPEMLRNPLNGDAPLVLDVRTRDEWDSDHLPSACHIPLEQLIDRVGDVPDVSLAVLCGTGYRSSTACSILQRAGRQDVSNISGGWEAWQQTSKSD